MPYYSDEEKAEFLVLEERLKVFDKKKDAALLQDLLTKTPTINEALAKEDSNKGRYYKSLVDALTSNSEERQKLTRLAIALALVDPNSVTEDPLWEARQGILLHMRNQIMQEEKQQPETQIDYSTNTLLQAHVCYIEAAPWIRMLYFNRETRVLSTMPLFQRLCEAIKNARSLTTINLSSNELDKWDLDGIQALCEAIKNARTLTTINLSSNDLDKWDLDRIQALCEAIKNAHALTELYLGFNGLDRCDLPRIQALCEAIKNARTLTKIDLRGNYLGKWDLPRIKALCEAIKNARTLTKIDLTLNYLNTCDLPRIQALCEAIKNARTLTKINLSSNDLDKWDLDGIQALCEAINKNFSITEIFGIQNLPPLYAQDIKNFLLRNQNIKKQIEEWEKVTENPIERPEKELSDIYQQIGDIESTLAEVGTTSTQPYLTRLANIRFAFFEQNISAGQHFSNAMLWLLNHEGALVALSNKQQKVFDGALCQQVGEEKFTPDKDALTLEKRITMLKSLILTLINTLTMTKQNSPTLISTSPLPNYSPDYSPGFHQPQTSTATPAAKYASLQDFLYKTRDQTKNLEINNLRSLCEAIEQYSQKSVPPTATSTAKLLKLTP